MQGKAGCWRKACFCSAAVRKDACRDVGGWLQEPQPEDFPGTENPKEGVLCRQSLVGLLFATLVPPGPGSDIRMMMGWTVMSKTEKSGVWFFQNAAGLLGRWVFPMLMGRVVWVRKGSYHTVWAVPVLLFVCVRGGPTIGPRTGGRCWPLLAGVWSAIAP